MPTAGLVCSQRLSFTARSEKGYAENLFVFVFGPALFESRAELAVKTTEAYNDLASSSSWPAQQTNRVK